MGIKCTKILPTSH